MANPWGDPTTEHYRKKNIRVTRAAGATALVNSQILAVANRLVEGLSLLEVEIPEEITSYDPAGTEGQRVGLALHLPIAAPPSPEVEALVTRWGFDGFRVDGSDLIELKFVGTPADAQRLSDEALAARIDGVEEPDVSGPPVVLWPGVRDLKPGDSGHDVRFLRLVLNSGDPNAPVDETLIQSVRRFQERRGAPVNGIIDADLWRRIIPAGRPHVGQADSGFIIRVLQAALATYEDATTKVTGTWGTLTTRDVTALQKEYNLRVASFVRAPEWALLLGPVNPRIEEARRIAKGIGVPQPAAPAEPIKPPQNVVGGYPTTGRFGGKLGIIPPGVTVKIGGMHPVGSPPPMSINGVDVEHLTSDEHKPVQHRDGKQPWCPVCKLTADGRTPTRKKVDPDAPPKKRPAARTAPKKTATP